MMHAVCRLPGRSQPPETRAVAATPGIDADKTDVVNGPRRAQETVGDLEGLPPASVTAKLCQLYVEFLAKLWRLRNRNFSVGAGRCPHPATGTLRGGYLTDSRPSAPDGSPAPVPRSTPPPISRDGPDPFESGQAVVGPVAATPSLSRVRASPHCLGRSAIRRLPALLGDAEERDVEDPALATEPAQGGSSCLPGKRYSRPRRKRRFSVRAGSGGADSLATLPR